MQKRQLSNPFFWIQFPFFFLEAIADTLVDSPRCASRDVISSSPHDPEMETSERYVNPSTDLSAGSVVRHVGIR